METSNGLISQLQTENEHLRSRINDFRAANAAYEQNLHAEHTAHNYTKQILMEDKRLNFDTIRQQQDVFHRLQADHMDTQRNLELEKSQLADSTYMCGGTLQPSIHFRMHPPHFSSQTISSPPLPCGV